MKKKMVLCTHIPEQREQEITQFCEIVYAGELKHGKGNAASDILCKECTGYEIIVLGDEYADADTIKTWIKSGMKFIGVAKGTPVTVDNEALKAAGIQLSYTPGRNRVAVAEYTIALMLAIARKIPQSAEGLKSGEHLGPAADNIYKVPDVKNVVWGPLDETHPCSDYGIGFELYGKKLGIAGFGAIGREVAVRAKAFGMEILGYDPYLPSEQITADGARAVDLDTLLKESDILSLHLPVIETTKDIVNMSWFSRMKSSACLINTARAAIIDQKDFIAALQQKKIAGAAIDVFWQEPAPANHPLLKMNNVVCTPHMAGLTTDVDNWSGEMIAQEVLAYIKGEKRKYIWNR